MRTGARSADQRAVRLGSTLSGTNLERAGDYNQRVVLQVVRRHSGITRAEIATMTGLTAPTIANITARLADAGLIRTTGQRRGGRGQPASRFAVDPDQCFSLGLNIDRDHLTLVSLDLSGNVRSRFTRQMAFAMPDDVLATVREGIVTLRASGNVDLSRVIGMGVALPDDLGRVALPHRPAAYEQWGEIDVAALLADVVDWPVHIDNDAAAAAIGEAQFGSGGDHASFFYILVSAGLGGGLVIDGTYFPGAAGRSGEIGFLPLGDGRVIQDVVSLSALADRADLAGIDLTGIDTTLGLPPGAEGLVDRWIDDAAEALVPALTAVNCLINPHAILVSGRLPDDVLDRLARRVEAALARPGVAIPWTAPVSRATLSRDAPATGAAILPFLDRMLPSDGILMK